MLCPPICNIPTMIWRLNQDNPWSSKRVIVTGGGGFLGRAVVTALKARGVETLFVPRRRDYDLRDGAAVKRLLADTTTPRDGQSTAVDLIVHLAANVGGIGANREHPGRVLLRQPDDGRAVDARGLGGPASAKFVAIGTICAYPKFTPVPFREDDALGRLPGRDQRSLRTGQEDAAGAGAGVSRSSTATTPISCCR